MKNFMNILLFTLLVTAFYTYVGHMVPQQEFHPPQELEIRPDMSTAELVEVGRELAAGKGTCMACHTLGKGEGGRFPDLENIGVKAESRRPDMSSLDYLAESLYEPEAFIVEGFNPGMPAVHKAPISLSDAEIIAIIAWMQTLGGEATVGLSATHKYSGASAQSESPVATKVAGEKFLGVAAVDGPGVYQKYGCSSCHSMSSSESLLGPSLANIGNRLTTPELYRALLEPDAVVAEGYAPGVMAASLAASGFYEKATAGELRVLVEFLSTRKGAQ